MTAAFLATGPAVPAMGTDPGPWAVAVVASADVPIDELTRSELRQLFSLERRFWKPGQPTTVLYPPPGSTTRESLLKHLCRTDERGLRRMVLEKLYRGEIDLAPKVAKSDEEALAFVAAGHGLVALVPAALADSADAAIIKILLVDGLKPGETGYPLAK